MSTIIVDTLTGKSTATTITIGSTPVVSASANSLTIRGEGSAQTSIQQGLAKAWAALNGSTFGLKDSFNITSATDNGTGDYTFTIANDMANANASLTANSGQATTRSITDCAAGTYELDLYASDGSTRGDSSRAFTALHGDLA
jgi:hypothetical protein